MKRNFYKSISELPYWELDPSVRNIVDQKSSSRRGLKKRIKRNDRKALDRYIKRCYNDDVEGRD